MKLFYIPNFEDKFYIFDKIESKHISKVLRLKNGNLIYFTNGKGKLYKAKIIDDNHKKVKISIIEIEKIIKKTNFLHIAIAPTKNISRFEWFLEKATEIGINEITPILCEHSERKNIKFERSEKIIISAMKQSLKLFLPKLNNMIKFEDFILKKSDNLKFISHCKNQKKISLKNAPKNKKKFLILIGAEGDFSHKEIKMAEENNFKSVSLGESRLRTETAGIVACHIFNLLQD